MLNDDQVVNVAAWIVLVLSAIGLWWAAGAVLGLAVRGFCWASGLCYSVSIVTT